MSDCMVKHICQKWIDVGLADECFWEGWPECPTPQDGLTPRMVLDRIEALIAERDEAWKRAAHAEEMWGKAEVKMAKAVEAGQTMDDGCDCERCSKARTTLAEIKSGIATTPYGLEGEGQDDE